MRVTTYDQPTGAPVPKMVAVGSAGAIITLLVTVLAAFGIIIPDDVSGSATAGIAAVMVIVSSAQTVLSFLAGYFKKDAKPVEAVKIIEEEGAK